MSKKHETRNSIFVIAAIAIATAVIIILNIQMILNVTARQTDSLGTLQMNDIRAELQLTLDEAKLQTLKIAGNVDILLKGGGTIDELDTYLRQVRSQLADGACINVYCAGPEWYVIPDFDAPADFDATERMWYIGAKQYEGDVYITQPYMDLASDYVCFTVSYLLPDTEVVVSLDYNLLGVQKYITEMSEGGRTALIVTEDGRIAGYNKSELLGKSLAEVLPEYVDILELEKNNTNQVVLTQVIDGVKQTVFCSKTVNNWYLILCVNNSELYKDSYKQFALLCAVNALLILAIVFLYLYTRKNRQKAELALRARDEFLSGMTSQLRAPIASIMNNSNPDFDINPKEGMERVREAAIHLSESVNNLLSYSALSVQEKRDLKTEEQSGALTGMNKRVRTAVIGIILVAMLVSVTMFSVTNIRLGNKQIHEEAERYDYELSQWVIEQKSILSMFCSMISANPSILDDYEGCVSFLDDITGNYTDISVVYMTNPEMEHTVIMNNGWQPDEGWHVEERQWYIDTVNSPDGFNISSPYFDEQTGLYCVTFSQLVYDSDGAFLGNFGIDFYMDKLIDILSESYTDTGYAFLVDADGSVINHPYAYYQMNQTGSCNVLDLNYRTAYANCNTISNIRDYDNVRKTCIAIKNEASHFTVIVAKNWWNIFGSIVIICIVFVVMFVICVYAVYYMISRLMKWQESVNERLQEAVDTATAAGKAKTQFLAQMSHEIRTPINAVLGMNEMIIRDSKEKDTREYALDIQSAGRTLLNLINSILDFSKIEDGKMEIIEIKYDTASLINDLVNMISERAEKKGLELKLEIDENLPMTMFGDDVRIRQVITNLLTNAVKYTQEGSVTMKLHGTRIGNDKINLSVSVSDTGIGIHEEDRDKLCQSFQRLDQERNHNIEGTGLGLSIVTRLLQMMGSELKIDSIYGEGSNFYFDITQTIVEDLPIGDFSKRREEAVGSLNTETTIYAPDAAVLVVDDNDMNLKVVRNLLKRTGIVPDTVSSGLQCIDAVEHKDYDIILLDHMMPGMDGIETLQRLKSANLLKNGTTVIALTANAISGAREMYLEAGFCDYLSKPIEVDKLEHKLAKYLPDSKLRQTPAANAEAASAAADTAPSPAAEPAVPSDETAEETPKLINYELGLSYSAGDMDIYKEVIQAYLDEAESKLEKLDCYYEAQDWKNYSIIAHAMKSTSLTIGAESLSALAKEHEFAGKEGRAEDIDASYFRLLELYQSVLEELKAYMNS